MERPYPLKVVDDFLSKESCNRLISDSQKFLKKNRMHRVHDGRDFIPSTSYTFERLINSSEEWKKFKEKISNPSFLDYLTKELGIKDNLFYAECFSTLRSEKKGLLNKIKLYSERSDLNHSSLKLIMANLFLRIYLQTKRRAIYFKNELIYRKKSVEILFEFSSQRNGYKIKPHIDSNSRRIIFILFLNDLDAEGKGGDHLTHYLDPNNVISVNEKILPKAGRIIFFENTKDSIHSVSEMKDYKTKRYFLYGSVTQLYGGISNLKHSIPTQWNLYY